MSTVVTPPPDTQAPPVELPPAPTREPGTPRPLGDEVRAAPTAATLPEDEVTGPERSGATLRDDEIAAMFDDIAPVYDRLNTFMTLGADARWRRRACQLAELTVGGSAIDVACGTGKLAALLAEQVGPFGRVEAVDLSSAMIERGARQHHSLVQLRFQVGDALALPFPDASFDAATISFGLRNLSDFEGGFRELRRVVRPGGTVVCLELSLPRPRAWARVYHAAFRRTAPLAARLSGASKQAYRYLPESLDGFPSPERLSVAMDRAGLRDVRFWRLSTGVVALHRGRVPDDAGEDRPAG